jgi:hypothetical protein
MRPVSMFLIPAVLAVVAGCEQRGPFVYVLESPQTVALNASATPTKVQQGESVVLHVERRISGQCWVYRPPVEVEPEVARDIQWQVEPEGAVQFHTDYQMDRTRVATMATKGKILLTPVSTVKCEEGRSVAGTTIEIEVS